MLPSLALAAVLLGGLSSLAASSVEAPDELPDLVRQADLIAEFELIDAHPEMLPDGSIQTVYTFSTLLPMKGSPASVQEIRMPGGEIAGRGLYVPGMPVLQIGDRQILFLSEEGAEKPWRMPVGLSAGAWRVSLGSAQPSVVSQAHREEGTDVRDYQEFVRSILEEVDRPH